MKPLPIDHDYLGDVLARLLAIPSPTGMTDAVVHLTCTELEALGIPYEVTRRGAIRATLPGRSQAPCRAVVAHLDTLGATVKGLKENGRTALAPIGTWPARMAEGARATLFCDGGHHLRGTILPLKVSGHVYGDEVDTQPAGWPHLEFRIDAPSATRQDLERLGVNVGDTVALDADAEFLDTGYVVARHLDDKAGVAAVLAAAKALRSHGKLLPMEARLLFTISEEVGVGASHVLHGDVAELVSVDNGTSAPGQNTSPYGVTIAMQDSSGPFDRHLTHCLIKLCATREIPHSRDVFTFYRSDAAAAVVAGNDIRTALICFALDASHGWERSHLNSLEAVARLLTLYLRCPPIFQRDRNAIGPLEDFPDGETLDE